MTRKALNEVLSEFFIAQKGGFYDIEIPTYREDTSALVKKLAETININITDEYGTVQIEDSIAFYRIKGTIYADESWWAFSTKQFRADLLAADANPKIIAHFVSVNSGGGEAWFLDVVAETMAKLTKPVVAHYENVAASAAVYLTINADKIYAATKNETIGSIGTMVSFLDIIPYYESLGIKYYEEYAHQSNLKNKKFNDLLDDKPEQYITEELDPLAGQFIEAVATARPITAKLGEEHPVFHGETFATEKSIEIGLIDGQMLMEDAVVEAHKLGFNQKNTLLKMNKLFKSI